MSGQPSLPGFAPSLDKPRRRCLWEAELRRLAAVMADERARDRQHADAAIAALCGQLDELRHRLADLEHGSGIADLHRAPSRTGGLRRFAGRLA